MSFIKKIFKFLEKKYSVILIIISLVALILVAFFYWTLYSNIMLKEPQKTKDVNLDQATLDKIIATISIREQNHLQSLQKQYRDIFK